MQTGITSTGDRPAAAAGGEGCVVALVGAGVFAHNVHKVVTTAGCTLACVVDEFRTGEHLGAPVFRACELPQDQLSRVDKFLVAISMPEHRDAAVARLLERGVPRSAVFPVDDDATLPMLCLVLAEHGDEALAWLRSERCTSMYDLERRFYGAGWDQALAGLDPNRKTIALCYYGRGGGFRRHLLGLIPRLRESYNLLALMDERLPGEPAGQVPELYMSPGTATGFDQADLAITAHFIPCSPDHLPKVNFLHTSFDFILEPEWLIARFDAGDPHYVFASTRATFDWLDGLARRGGFSHRLCLIPGGYTRLDDNLRHAQVYQGPVDSLVYAPTLSLNAVRNHELTYSMPHAVAMIEALLDAFPDRKVIFRPHPNDLQLIRAGRDDALARPFIELLSLCDSHSRCRLDDSGTFYMDSYNASAVMISDTSSTAYTYALSTLRPVVFYSPHDDQVVAAMGSDSHFIRDRGRIGAVARDAVELVGQVRAMLDGADQWRDRIASYRDEVCFNLGRAEEYFVEHLEDILAARPPAGWRCFNWS